MRNLSAKDDVPLGISSKFSSDGRVKPFSGNTFICPLTENNNTQLLKIFSEFCRELLSSVFASKLALLPPSSYHMTVFDGVNDQAVGSAAWPRWIPEKTKMSMCDDLIVERIKDFKHECGLPLQMTVNEEDPILKGWDLTWAPIIVSVKSIDDSQERSLRHLRDRLADCLQIRYPNHNEYGFHVTLAYVFQRLSGEELGLYQTMRKKYQEQLKEKNAIFELGAPQLCSFRDMLRFRPILTLN